MEKSIKTILIILFLLFSGIGAFSANVTRNGNTFKTEQSSKVSDTKSNYTWEDKEGNTYPIFITKKGACYVLRTSKKTNKEYKYYLPKEVQSQIKAELGIQ